MLGKLIRHEWKETCNIGGVMLLVTAVVTFIGWLTLRSFLWRNMESSGFGVRILDVIRIFVLVVYILMLVGVVYGITIYLGVHFYRTMYTDRGYLTHTLPVSKHEILAAKILVGGLWMLIFIVLMVLSLSFVIVAAFRPPHGVFWSFWDVFSDAISQTSIEYNLNFTHYLWTLLVVMVFSPFATVTTLFGAISMGQLFPKYRALMAIVCYIAVLVVENLIGHLLQNLLLAPLYSSLGSYIDIALGAQAVVSLLIAAAMYAASWYVASRKLNME